MFILNPNNLLGDSISALPAIWTKAQQEKVFLVFKNKNVESLLPNHPNLIHIKKIDDFFYSDFDIESKIRYLHISPNFHQFCGAGLHMAQGYYHFLDMPIPSEVPTCPLNIETNIEVKSYDFLISAGSRSDCQNNKMIPVDRWQIIIDWLREKNYTVAALMSERPEEHQFNNCDNIIGLPLKTVGAYIKNVKKIVLTIDNGLSHFCRLLGVNHCLLYPAILPPTWVNNPNSNCLMLQKEPLLITVDEIKTLIEHFLNLSFSA